MTGRQCSRRMAGTAATGCEDIMLSDAAMTVLRPAPARRTHESEGRPTLERHAAREREAACAIASERGAGLRREQAREHDLSVGRNQPRHRGGGRFERIEQDIGEDQVVRGAGAAQPPKNTGGIDYLHYG